MNPSKATSNPGVNPDTSSGVDVEVLKQFKHDNILLVASIAFYIIFFTAIGGILTLLLQSPQEFWFYAFMVNLIVMIAIAIPVTWFVFRDNASKLLQLIAPKNKEISKLRFYLFSRFSILIMFMATTIFVVIFLSIGFVSMNGI